MKKRLLKVLTLGLALIMCLSLTACGGETDHCLGLDRSPDGRQHHLGHS